MQLRGLVHFTIPVTNVDRAQKFYSDVLGMTLVARTPPHLPGMAFMRVGDDIFVLTESPTPLNVTNDDQQTVLHTAFSVDSDKFDAAMTELSAAGVKVVQDEVREHGVFIGRSAYFHDPDRNVLEIIDLKYAAFNPVQNTAQMGGRAAAAT